jgi:hypothetical protein
MLQRDPPVHVRLAQLSTFRPWLLKLQAACGPDRVERIAATRRKLMAHAAPALAALLQVAQVADTALAHHGHIQLFAR